MPASNIDRLRETLDELFMLDRADLDFGLYRIMNVRRDEVRRFLDHDLLPKVQTALGQAAEGERAALKEEIDQRSRDLIADGQDPANSRTLRELSEKYDATEDTAATEAEVYGHLVSFFRRYYKEGDFISLRRYKEGVYAIPYEGEEVKLHWANADQYYIKSTEQFRDYTFLVSHEDEPERRVHFKLVEADTERNNNRAQAGQDRRFVLVENDPVAEVDGELVVRFEYRPANGAKQDALNAEAEATVLDHPAAKARRAALSRDVRRDGAKDALSLLRKHLNTYTDKNTFDYFIHKDLGGFLRRELDFYLKNEVLRLEDIDTEGATSATLDAALRKVRAIRAVGLPIIEFLASLEEFQKRLWLKKKFVVETHWCVTLDRVPPELYAAANDRQREKWIELFAINEIKGDVVTPGYSAPLTEAFLKANQHLVLDTSLFDRDFTERLLADIDAPDGLDALTDGLLVHSDNFQALELLQTRFGEQVQCIYIDPPYNTGDGDFPYKDSYQHSSWLSMMLDRARGARRLLTEPGFFTVSVDENESARIDLLGTDVFGPGNRKADFIWHSRKSKQNDIDVSLSHNHTYMWTTAPGKRQLLGAAVDAADFKNPDDHPRGPWSPVPIDAPGVRENSSFYPIENPNTGQEYLPKEGRHWSLLQHAVAERIERGDIWFGKDGKGRPQGRQFYEDVKDNRKSLGTIWSDVGTATDGTKQLEHLMGRKVFATVKPLGLLKRIVESAVPTQGVVLDYFAGSGTTAQATIDLNREDGGERRYILIEMAEYFDSVLKPRVLKAAYSKDWKDGKPVGREGVSQLIKVIRLESYEDTLTNLRDPKLSDQQASLLKKASHDLRQQYALRYWITEETRGSASLLDLDRFEDPWSYTLEVGQGSAAETKPVTVDLVETFNYLLGLRVQHVSTHRDRGAVRVEGRTPPSPGHPEGEKVLVVWRNTKVMDAEGLDRYLGRLDINPRDLEYDVIYVNGDNHLENSRRADETWKVRLIEDEFHRLMFETAEQERTQ